ncbi:MAG: ATP-binding protein, partial [Acetobacteraceae bacterium]
AEQGVADSGDLETDLPNLFLTIGEAAKSSGRPSAVLIDELQYLSEAEFSALIMSMHKVAQVNLPVILIGAGLPQILALAGESKSYAERLFRYPKIGELAEDDARTAIRKPVLEEGAEIEADAVDDILRISQRYPYFLQQWGYDAWNQADGNVITRDDVDAATEVSIRALDDNFFRVRFDRCTPAERRYMRALADFGAGSHRSGDVAALLGVKTQSVGPVRSSLISKGMIYSPQHGDTAFTVPLFDAYMRRVMTL